MQRSLQTRCTIAMVRALAVVIMLTVALAVGASHAQEPPVTYTEGGGGKNVVTVTNHRDGSTQIRGAIQLNRIPGPDVAPSNAATSWNVCTGCESLSVALQINLISRDAAQITPENSAVAVNFGCDGCLAMAWAVQYVVQVDDPTQVPPDVQALITELRRELTATASEGVSVCQAVPRLNAVILQFAALAQSLYDQQFDATPNLVTCPL